MSKILIVEDCEDRIKEFERNIGTHDLFFARSSKRAILFLMREHISKPFDYIFLDHDLDEDNAGINGEGIDVAKKLIQEKTKEKELYRNTIVIIHSMNPVGADNMALILRRAEFETHIIPYSWIEWNKWRLNLKD